jgi:hypothetical protein
MRGAGSVAASKLTSAPIDRRERRPVSMRGHILLEDGTTAEILLLDLSYEGCGIETPAALSPGQPVTLSVLRRGAIEAEVCWCAQGKAGLVFHAEAEPEEPHHPRISERLSLTAEMTMRRLGQPNYRVRVFDLSSHGCKVEIVDRPRIGEHLLVRFHGLEALEAEVCWVEGFFAGLRFEKTIHPAVFDLLVERLTAGT